MWLHVIVKCCQPCGSKPFHMMIRKFPFLDSNHQAQGADGTSQAPKACMQIASRSTWMVLKRLANRNTVIVKVQIEQFRIW